MTILNVLGKLEAEFNGAHGRTPWRHLKRFMALNDDGLDNSWKISWLDDDWPGDPLVNLTIDHDKNEYKIEWLTGSGHSADFIFVIVIDHDNKKYILEEIRLGNDTSETFYPTIRELFVGENIKVGVQEVSGKKAGFLKDAAHTSIINGWI